MIDVTQQSNEKYATIIKENRDLNSRLENLEFNSISPDVQDEEIFEKESWKNVINLEEDAGGEVKIT